MTDLAALGIVVKTTGLKEAVVDLDKLAKEGAAAEKQADGLAKKWTASGKAIGVAIAAGVAVAGLALRKYFQNTIEAERVQAQLEARIKSTGMAARLSLGDLNKMAAALQFKTSFDDESIGEVQSLLLTFTKIGRETFPEATEAVLNLSTAMGTDLNSAALQVGKALNDPVKGITALARAGVQFSESQKAIIKDLVKTGDVAGAQTLILKELETQMGGAATAARNTLGGAIKALQNSFDNLLEGDSGDAGIKGTRDAIEDFNRTLNDPSIKSGVDSTVSGILQIANAALTLIANLGNAGSALAEFFGSAEKRGSTMLRNQINDQEGKVFAQQRMLKRTASVPFLGAGDAKLLKQEQAKLKQLQDALVVAERREQQGEMSRRRAIGVNIIDGSAPPKGAAEPDEEKKGGRARTVRAMPDFSKEAADDLRRLVEETAAADDAFASMAATLQGPLAAAQYEYEQNLEQITELGTKAGRSAVEIADAKALETQRYEEQREEIEKTLDVYGGLIEVKQFDLDLMGLSNIERQTAIDLQRLGRKATQEEAAAIRDLNQAYEDQSKTIDLMDDFRGSLADGFTDAALNFRNAGDIIKDTIDDIAARLTQWIADQLIAKAFGDQGSTGAGTGGGDWISKLLGMFTGSGSSMQGSMTDLFASSGGWGWANGGYTGKGGKHDPAGIVHKGEVVFSQSDIARAGGVGNVEAMRLRGYANGGYTGDRNGQTSAPGGTVMQTFVIQGLLTSATKDQLSRQVGIETEAAMRKR